MQSVQVAGKYIFRYYREFLKPSSQSLCTDRFIPKHRFKYHIPLKIGYWGR